MKKMKKKLYCILSSLLAFSSGYGISATERMRSSSQNDTLPSKNKVLGNKKNNKRSKSVDYVAPITISVALGIISKNAFDVGKEKWKRKNSTVFWTPSYDKPGKHDPKEHDIPKHDIPKEHDDPKPLPKTAMSVTKDEQLNNLNDWTPVNFTGTSCFVAALSKLMYNPKSAESGIYSTYSKKSLEDIKKEIKDYYLKIETDNPDFKKKININVKLKPCDDEDKDGYNFASNLYYASIINRSAFYDACYKKLQEKSNQVFQMNFGATAGGTGSQNWVADMFPVKADKIKFGNWDLYSDVKNPILGGDPKTPKLNDGHRFEQLFHGSSYRYAEECVGNELRYSMGGEAVGCFINLEHGSVLNLIHPLSLNLTDHILEPDANYIVIQGNDFKDTYKSIVTIKDNKGNVIETKINTKHGIQRNNYSKLRVPIKLSAVKTDEFGNKIKDGDSFVWTDDIEDYVDVSENGEFQFNGKTYVIVGVETANGGHCEAFMPKYFVDDNNITLAGWLQHYCGASSGLRVVKPGEKFTIQQLLMHCEGVVGHGPTAGIIIKSVPKEDVIKYDYYKINQYKK